MNQHAYWCIFRQSFFSNHLSNLMTWFHFCWKRWLTNDAPMCMLIQRLPLQRLASSYWWQLALDCSGLRQQGSHNCIHKLQDILKFELNYASVWLLICLMARADQKQNQKQGWLFWSGFWMSKMDLLRSFGDNVVSFVLFLVFGPLFQCAANLKFLGELNCWIFSVKITVFRPHL